MPMQFLYVQDVFETLVFEFQVIQLSQISFGYSKKFRPIIRFQIQTSGLKGVDLHEKQTKSSCI